jgi:transcriptional regulator with XRE-family HTH domain
MAKQRPPSDLRGRRADLRVTEEQMAKGLGVGREAIRDIENGSDRAGHRALYSAWLTRLEALSEGKRLEQFARATAGDRFG